MATFQSFEDIEAWQKARTLTKTIYSLSQQGAFSKDFGLKDQIRRASVSIMSNIAEGFQRSGTGEFIQFLSIAKGSVGEVKSQLFVALDQQYIDQKGFDEVVIMATEVEKVIAGLMHYLRKAKVRGVKFKVS